MNQTQSVRRPLQVLELLLQFQSAKPEGTLDTEARRLGFKSLANAEPHPGWRQ